MMKVGERKTKNPHPKRATRTQSDLGWALHNGALNINLIYKSQNRALGSKGVVCCTVAKKKYGELKQKRQIENNSSLIILILFQLQLLVVQ